MRVTTLSTETSLAAIAERLYANMTDSSRKMAESALLKANPHLARSDAFRPGAIIQIPDLSSLKLSKAELVQDDPTSQTHEVLIQALTSYQSALNENISSVRADLEGQIRLLSQPEILRVLKSRDTPANKDLKSLLKKRIQDNESRQNNLMAALDQATTDLKGLLK